MRRITLGMDTSGRPLVIDDRTQAKLSAAESALGFEFTIVQGSYRAGNGAAASAGTHDGGGVIDLRVWNLPPNITPREAVKALRLAGFIAWYRDQTHGFDPHIHAIDYGNPRLSVAAERQVDAYEAGRNGLASNGPDDGPRVHIPKNPPEDDMPSMKELKDELAPAIVRELFDHKINAEQTFVQAIRDAGKADAVLRALADLPDRIERGLPTTSSLTRNDVRRACATAVRDVLGELDTEEK